MMDQRPEADCFTTQSELFNGPAPDGHCLKTSQEFTNPIPAETLLPWLARWLGADLAYRQTDGEMAELLAAQKGLLSGQLWMRSTSVSHSAASEVTLSQTLETGPVAPRYFLSPRACLGIIRRAKSRNTNLSPSLIQALQTVADQAQASLKQSEP